ncbi:pilus assembly protein TadG-related protein [Phosphitispora sp. TUW77]|uniref:pilus assembly protein TadG-related protein n=1 Tax=Phosphitispora sp. TUW77 TaxID=3152361 RepID=UPI003AB3548A
MRNLISRFLRSEKGQVIVILALAFTVLLGFVGLAVDTGVMYLEHNRLVRAADAAALAGAQELPANPSLAEEMAGEYAAMNGIEPEQLSINISDDNKSISVSADKTVNLVFAKVFGFDSRQVSTEVSASVAAVKSLRGAVPFSVMEQVFNYGDPYVLKEGASGSTSDGARWCGWFGALDFTGGGGGAHEYEDMIVQGFSGKISIGDIIYIEPGNMAGPTADGVQQRIDSCTHTPSCTWNNHDPDCPRVIYVPIVEEYSGSGGNRQVKVVGFAAFFLEGVENHEGNNGDVVGRFIFETVSAETDDSIDGYGLLSVKLLE